MVIYPGRYLVDIREYFPHVFNVCKFMSLEYLYECCEKFMICNRARNFIMTCEVPLSEIRKRFVDI